METPLEMCSQKSIAEWIQACYMDKEEAFAKVMFEAGMGYEAEMNNPNFKTIFSQFNKIDNGNTNT